MSSFQGLEKRSWTGVCRSGEVSNLTVKKRVSSGRAMLQIVCANRSSRTGVCKSVAKRLTLGNVPVDPSWRSSSTMSK